MIEYILTLCQILLIYITTIFIGLLLTLFSSILISCSSVKDAGKVLRNEKTKSTDEFLVKKREPLVLPPDYNEIPKPGSINEKKINEKDKIKKILKVPKDQNLEKNKASNVEESILEKIRK